MIEKLSPKTNRTDSFSQESLTTLALEKLGHRLKIIEAAKAKMLSSEREMHFTPEMAVDYESLLRLLQNFSQRSHDLASRGIDQFSLGKYQTDLDCHQIVRGQWSWGKFFLPRRKLKIIYQPLKLFLNKLLIEEYCGWRVEILLDSNGTSLNIIVFLLNPEIQEIRWVDRCGEELNQLHEFWGGY